MLDRLGTRQRARYIDVTAITPTPLGEGKTNTTIGPIQGPGALGKMATGAIRRPSGFGSQVRQMSPLQSMVSRLAPMRRMTTRATAMPASMAR